MKRRKMEKMKGEKETRSLASGFTAAKIVLGYKSVQLQEIKSNRLHTLSN